MRRRGLDPKDDIDIDSFLANLDRIGGEPVVDAVVIDLVEIFTSSRYLGAVVSA